MKNKEDYSHHIKLNCNEVLNKNSRRILKSKIEETLNVFDILNGNLKVEVKIERNKA